MLSLAFVLAILARLAIANEQTGMVTFPTEPQQLNNSEPVVQPMLLAMMQEGKKIESWTPNQPDPTLIYQPPTMPFPQNPAPPQQQQQQQQPFMPANYYLPGNQYGPPPTTEFRSEHYAYPYEPNYPTYQVAQPPIDTSLLPTTKHFVIVSFIGLLLLFAIIQNSIAAAKRKDALVEVLTSRKKRELVTFSDLNSMPLEVESAIREDARVSCIQRTLCYENRKLFEDLGVFGKVLAKYLTSSVQSSLKDTQSSWSRLVEDAAEAGLRGENCDVLYRDCDFEPSQGLESDNSEMNDEEETTTLEDDT